MATAADLDAELKKLAYEEERGSAYPMFSTVFGEWDDGKVFEYDFSSLDIAKALEKDGKLSCIEQALTLPILSAPWKIVPATGGEKIAEELETFLRMSPLEGGMQTPFQMVLAQATSARAYKKAFFEKVYKQADGKVVYDAIRYRPPETCRIARDPKTGAYRGFRQTPVRQGAPTLSNAATRDVDILPPYAWVHINGQRRNPLSGVSDLQVPLWAHETKMKILYMWSVFCTTQAEPRTVVKSSDGAGSAAKKIAQLRGGGVTGVDKATEIELLESNGTGAKVFQDMVAYLDTQMSSAVLANFTDLATTASGSGGSYALSRDQSAFFIESLEAYAAELAESITHNVLGDLVVYNHGRNAKFPTFQFGSLVNGDVDRCITLLQGLASGQSVLPFEFLDELTIKTATYLELDVARVREGMEKAAEQAEAKQEMSMEAQRQGLEGQAQALKQGKAGMTPEKKAKAEQTKRENTRTAAKVGFAANAVKVKQTAEAAGGKK